MKELDSNETEILHDFLDSLNKLAKELNLDIKTSHYDENEKLPESAYETDLASLFCSNKVIDEVSFAVRERGE